MRRPLRVTDIRVAYGPVVAVDGVSLEVEPGTVRVILGPNGAGKSSLLNGICGIAPRTGGEVVLGESKLSKRRAHRVARAGVIQVPEGRRVIAPLTVQENLLIGRYAARGRDDGSTTVADIYALFPRLEARRNVRAGLLSGGEQQMLAIGRALMSKPEIMLLDEPSMGLAPNLVLQVLEYVAQIAESGIGVLMVEQNIAALDIASYGYVLRQGTIVAEGPAVELSRSADVMSAYMGGTAMPASGATTS